MVFVVSLMLLVFCELWLFLCLVYGDTTLFTELCCYWFSWLFLLFVSCAFILCFESSELVGKEEI